MASGGGYYLSSKVYQLRRYMWKNLSRLDRKEWYRGDRYLRSKVTGSPKAIGAV